LTSSIAFELQDSSAATQIRRRAGINIRLSAVIASEAKQSSLSEMVRFGVATRRRNPRGRACCGGELPQRWIASLRSQ
jgi:hypothetical protein